ncbi:uncharacterized protein LOC121996417 isoform X1 [Zingiber officinale]|uniref:uncharacterized protein LOC121996417 isoform X1 n=2 Tax=Zingiber officinale TaxID=94328 RepID=UPI001C4BB5A8|nr:uncharacterized protein LOC121996417 isoform X1 [Zingiber officinale]XP_042406318.1 uncharacterized protein LOC121996417 isoform X1 [Zingiber officinale]XP_042406319.1 uncharacterized protein LOC121996417 isoform X1 [Zingiber officinale]XP_042406320.1 uncharacterized protein LOC121996417 isoform X1 [Zingiber officinale]
MEKIPAACAMTWSIELEKGLRSKCPDKRILAIEKMGPILQTWSEELNITREIADMYNLVVGEDRTFANTILLRLANAFKCGDNHTRQCVLKVFLLEMPHIRKERKRYNGILAKRRVPNYIEMLKRVKVVYDTGDAEAKTLSLRLFGCWADLAKDSTHIRHIVLQSLQSSNISEVKASLFAAGCFALLSEDFALITLEILLNIVGSSMSPFVVSIAAIHAIPRMQCSSMVASKAYKAGKKLLLGALNVEFKAEMLSSLSKLAFKSTTLYFEQVDLLLSFLSNDTTYPLKVRALKCLYFSFGRPTCCFNANESVILKLLHVVDNNDHQVHVQCKALKILCKLFSSVLPDVTYVDLHAFLKRLLLISEQKSSRTKISLVHQLLVHILCSLKMAERGHCCTVPTKWCRRCFELQRNPNVLTSEIDASAIECQVISMIVDYLTHMINQTITNPSERGINMETDMSCTDLIQECRRKFRLILLLATEYPLAPLTGLDRIICMLQTLKGIHDKSSLEGIRELVSQEEFHMKSWGLQVCHKQDLFYSEIAICIIRFMNAYMKKLNGIASLSSEVRQKVKLLVECIQHSWYASSAAYEIFCLCQDPFVVCSLGREADNQAQNSDESGSGSIDRIYDNICWVNQEWKSMEFIQRMLQKRNYWAAYRAGKYSCLEGLWFSATFAFRKLMDHIDSANLFCWLKCLMLLAGSESEIKLLLFPKAGRELVNGLQTVKNYSKILTSVMGGDNDTIANLSGWDGKFTKVCGRICSAEETLASAGVSDGIYYFQRWFLHLRAKLFNILADTLVLLNSSVPSFINLCNEEENKMLHGTKFTQNLNVLMSGLAYESFRLNNLAKCYDLLASSFLDIDSQSFKAISSMALHCSLLSFCIAFTMHFPCSPAYRNVPKFSSTLILRDLIERFWTTDDKISRQLMSMAALCNENGQSCSGICTATPDYVERDNLQVFNFCISSTLSIQEEVKGAKSEEIPLLSLRGLRLLCDIFRRWMEIPFHIPKYFFTLRSCIGAELFILNADPGNRSELSVLHGDCMSLSLCIQLKNASTALCPKVMEIYSILAAKPSKQSSPEKGKEDCFNAFKIDEMLELNSLLMMHVKDTTRKDNKINFMDSPGYEWVIAFSSFRPNKRGQGFSSCLLDVSAFPEGIYQIQWHSCCIDESGTYWTLLPLTPGAFFTVKMS